MPKGADDITVDNSTESAKNGEFYPFYVYRKNSRRRSSVQSLLHRRNCRLVKRLVRKSGKSAILRNTENSQHTFRYMRDFTNTLIEGSWKLILLIVCIAFNLTWLIFAGLWMIVSSESMDVDGEPCLEGIDGFAGYLLFSVETQSTIGYGNRYINGYCPEAVFLMCIQIIVGVIICGSVICIVYMKMIGPQKVHSMACFSKIAVVHQRDGEMCLIFRVRDSANKYECLTTMSAYLVQKKRGELFLKSIKLEPAGILIWPVEIVHRINDNSPFWDLSAKDLILKRFEIIVIMDGTSLATSHTSRTTTSYLSREIKWGHKFKPCTLFDKKKDKYIVDHSLFNKTEEFDTPLCSAQKLREMYDEIVSLAAPKLYLSPSTSKYSSPMFNSLKISQPWPEEEEETVSGSVVTTSAIVHVSKERGEKKKESDKKIARNVPSSSSSEEDVAFEDLSVEDLTEENIKSHSNLVGKTKNMLHSLQSFVLQDNSKRLHLNGGERKFNETSF
ncbi:G protein-activated inward rectifier potassium channel 4 [Anoplophora glabripennis]|uniref:G protein-activated inward rectifier potassium channel 4 n=1 Tax=Anoplophora glabripennis TaxID=217634 RepID=UPI000874E7AE|nr:G protein-activated inward rectifier potassium channel 4 [Anoplophora glabripennis]